MTDNRFPYRVFGAQQDNTTVEILSRTRGGIGPGDWHPVGGCEWLGRAEPDDPGRLSGCYGAHDRPLRFPARARAGDVVARSQRAIGQAP